MHPALLQLPIAHHLGRCGAEVILGPNPQRLEVPVRHHFNSENNLEDRDCCPCKEPIIIWAASADAAEVWFKAVRRSFPKTHYNKPRYRLCFDNWMRIRERWTCSGLKFAALESKSSYWFNSWDQNSVIPSIMSAERFLAIKFIKASACMSVSSVRMEKGRTLKNKHGQML